MFVEYISMFLETQTFTELGSSTQAHYDQNTHKGKVPGEYFYGFNNTSTVTF